MTGLCLPPAAGNGSGTTVYADGPAKFPLIACCHTSERPFTGISARRFREGFLYARRAPAGPLSGSRDDRYRGLCTGRVQPRCREDQLTYKGIGELRPTDANSLGNLVLAKPGSPLSVLVCVLAPNGSTEIPQNFSSIGSHGLHPALNVGLRSGA